jgi:hypothetical protein
VIALTKREARAVVRFLGKYQELLESAIDANLVRGTAAPMRGSSRQVARDRKDWRAAEDLIKVLERGR